ncbi:hypothetical protein [Francisella sp. 19X1-34]|uniref:hypothetical protein n=1 Tax=Francisella sp. 19X1-34 TaxID=3087177 RepID=UPI002E34D281|nr:hypothetical protein [Francisella sp. 19X1-34]MED7788502.1 hypothetical protein [Francisella sp. 19X1-34]
MFLHDNIICGLEWKLSLSTKKSILQEHKGQYGLYLNSLNIYAISSLDEASEKKVSAAAFLATKYSNCLVVAQVPNQEENFWVCFIEDGYIAPIGSVINDINLRTYMYKKKDEFNNQDVYYSGDTVVSLQELIELLPYFKEKITMHQKQGHDYHIMLDIAAPEFVNFFDSSSYVENIFNLISQEVLSSNTKALKKVTLRKFSHKSKKLYIGVPAVSVFCIFILVYYYISYENSLEQEKKRQQFMVFQQTMMAERKKKEYNEFIEKFKVKSIARTILITNLLLEDERPLVYGWQISSATISFGDTNKSNDSDTDTDTSSNSSKDDLKLELVYKRRKYSNIDQVPRIKKVIQADSYTISKDNNYASFIMHNSWYDVNQKINKVFLKDKKQRKDSMDYLISELQSENINFEILDNNSSDKKTKLKNIEFSGYSRSQLFKLYLIVKNIDNVVVDKISLDFDKIGNVDSWKITGEFYA